MCCAENAELGVRLLSMMEEGQTFLLYQLGVPPKRQKLFYRNPHPVEESLPGLLYLCELNQRPKDMNTNQMEGLDLCTITDIYLV